MDVEDWLRALGFERYQAAFREIDVDAELLLGLIRRKLFAGSIALAPRGG